MLLERLPQVLCPHLHLHLHPHPHPHLHRLLTVVSASTNNVVGADTLVRPNAPPAPHVSTITSGGLNVSAAQVAHRHLLPLLLQSAHRRVVLASTSSAVGADTLVRPNAPPAPPVFTITNGGPNVSAAQGAQRHRRQSPPFPSGVNAEGNCTPDRKCALKDGANGRAGGTPNAFARGLSAKRLHAEQHMARPSVAPSVRQTVCK